jgi:hypothetical protein
MGKRNIDIGYSESVGYFKKVESSEYLPLEIAQAQRRAEVPKPCAGSRLISL